MSSLSLRGKRGIRTPGTVARTPHFECGPFDHSGIFPLILPLKYLPQKRVQIYEKNFESNKFFR